MLKQKYFIHLLLFVLLCILTTNAMAKRPSSVSTDSCLSNKELTILAKQALPELQAIDPSVTLTDVKNVIKSAGDCASLDEINAALAQYSDELSANTGSITTNTAPTISGTPDNSVTEEVFYIFTPTAMDADNDTLIFSVSNLPSWASFDATTGTVYGTPLNADVGSYDNISIKVSDGTDTTILPAFSIEVLATPTDTTTTPNYVSTTISWTIPTTRILGDPLSLSELKGYNIYYGTAPGNYTDSIAVEDAQQTSTSVTLQSGQTYYFIVEAIDTDGNPSPESNVITRSL